MKKIDVAFFNALTEQAKLAERSRVNHNLHCGYDDKVQRLFIAMEPESYVRPHLHSEPNKWEFFCVVKGALLFLIYDEQGLVIDKQKLAAGGDIPAIEIPPNTWHSTVALEAGTVFFEVKEGPYVEMNDKGFAPWSPAEGDDAVEAFLKHLKNVKIGQSAKL